MNTPSNQLVECTASIYAALAKTDLAEAKYYGDMRDTLLRNMIAEFDDRTAAQQFVIEQQQIQRHILAQLRELQAITTRELSAIKRGQKGIEAYNVQAPTRRLR